MFKTFSTIFSITLCFSFSTLHAHSSCHSDTWMQTLWESMGDLDENEDGKISHNEYTAYWERLYDFADVNKDGNISDLEWRLVLEGQKFSARLGHTADVDKNNYISASEAEAYWSNRFGKADINNDGSLSIIEARALLESKLMGVYGEDTGVKFKAKKAIDSNGDGTVSSKEFLSYWTDKHGKADINNDGKVSTQEYRAIMESTRMEY